MWALVYSLKTTLWRALSLFRVWFGVNRGARRYRRYVKWVWWCGGGTIWSGTLYEFDGINFTYDLLDEEHLNGSSTCGNQLDVFNDDARAMLL